MLVSKAMRVDSTVFVGVPVAAGAAILRRVNVAAEGTLVEVAGRQPANTLNAAGMASQQ